MQRFQINSKISNYISQVLGQIGGRLIGFAFIIVVARELKSAQFGVFSFCMSIGYLVLSLMDFGLDPLTAKWIARGEDAYFKKVVRAKMLTIGFGASLMVLFSACSHATVRLPMASLVVGFAALSGMNLIVSYFRGREEMIWEGMILFFQKSLLLLVGFFLISQWPNAISAATALSVSAVVALGLANAFLDRRFQSSVFQAANFHWAEIRQVLREAFPLALVGLLWVIYYRIDTVMLGVMKGMVPTGIYSGAYRITEGFILGAAIIMIVQFPDLARFGEMEDKDALFRRMKRVGSFLIITSIALASAGFFFAHIIFSWILGPGYEKSIDVFRILVLALMVIYPGQLVTHALIALDMQRSYMVVAMACAGTNVVLNLVLIPSHGAMGAAWATVITEAALTATCSAILFRVYKRELIQKPKNGKSIA